MPYRTGVTSDPRAPDDATCPACDAAVLPQTRACARCGVRFADVRCAHCFWVQRPGDHPCERCGRSLELEPATEPTLTRCPRCQAPLERTTGLAASPLECAPCGGLFVPRELLVALMCHAETEARVFEVRRGLTGASEPVRYLACPVCAGSMNRTVFGRSSGIVVDVCRQHGTWFDPAELSSALAFAASGGLERAREREALERAAARERRVASFQIRAPASSHELRFRPSRDELWLELLRAMFD